MNILQEKKILPTDQNRMTKEAKLCYSPLEKTFENKTKTTEVQRKQKIEALEVLTPAEQQQKQKLIEDIFPKDQQNNETKKELNQIKKQKNKWIGSISFMNQINIHIIFKKLC